MTPDELDEIRARADRAAEHVGRLATKEDRWTMSVPVRETDSDVLLMEVADQDVPWLLAEVERLRRGRDIWRAERDRLAGVVERVEALHAPRTVQVITGDCSTEECGHEDECPTVPFRQCVECDRIADEIDTYYSERGVAPTEWPCPTIAAIEGADS